MDVGIHANMCDQATHAVSKALYVPFRDLSALLQGDYGGAMEQLWIDLELIESRARDDGSRRFPFRFAKRVSGRSRFSLPAQPDKFNVGHYSVRPDFRLIASLPTRQAVLYALGLIYDSTEVLNQK